MTTAVKLCDHCKEPLANRRFRYHDDCKEPARLAAKLAQRQCKRCKKVKAPSSFSDDSTRPDGKYPWCKTCQTDYMVGNRIQDSEAALNGHVCPMCDTPVRGHANRRFCSNSCKDRVKVIKVKYGMEVAEYRKLVTDTGGHCPLCDRVVRKWNIDHNHQTQKVTGVVCTQCNIGALASTFHSVEFVRRLLAYLEQTPAERLGIDAIVPEEHNRPSNLHKVWKFRR